MQAKSGARIQVCYLVLQLPVLPPSVIGNKVSLSLLVCFPAFFLLYQVNLNAGYSRLNKSHISVILEFLFASIHSIAQAGLLILEVVLSIIFSC